jgi:hypothetical protein
MRARRRALGRSRVGPQGLFVARERASSRGVALYCFRTGRPGEGLPADAAVARSD